MATKQKKGTGTPQQSQTSEKPLTPKAVNEFFDRQFAEVLDPQPRDPHNVPSTDEVDTNPREDFEPPIKDEDEEQNAELTVAKQHKSNYDDIADALATADENTVVYRSKYKGHYLSLDAGYSEEYMNAGMMRKRQAKHRFQFKMNLYSTTDPDKIKALDTYIMKFTRRKQQPPIMRLDQWQTLSQPNQINVDEAVESMDFKKLEEIYEKRKRQLSGIQEIKRGTITT